MKPYFGRFGRRTIKTSIYGQFSHTKSTSFIMYFFLFTCLPLSLTQGESVEDNAYVVLRLLIRRPECFGPALRGDGGTGLLEAMKEAISISEDPSMDGPVPSHQSLRTQSVSDMCRFESNIGIPISSVHTNTHIQICSESTVQTDIFLNDHFLTF